MSVFGAKVDIGLGSKGALRRALETAYLGYNRVFCIILCLRAYFSAAEIWTLLSFGLDT